MLASYEGDAVRCAEARASAPENEPAVAARWHLIADTIRMVSDGSFAVQA